MEQREIPGLKVLSGSLALVLVLHAVFLLSMANWLWGRDHYQFFPLILIGSLALAWHRLNGLEWSPVFDFSLRVGAYLGGTVAVFLLANVTGSHWLGTLAAISACWTTVWFIGGATLADALRGPVALLLLAVPLPLNLDLRLILGLQKIATLSAGGLLDLAGIGHTISGVAIQTASRDYMVEEACSGVHSLFSSLAAMSFLAAVSHYGIIRIGLTLLQTGAWVCVANCLRVFSIVFAREKWGIDLETGMPHEALGICTYALGLLLALSTDQILRFIVPIDADSQSDFKKKPSEAMMTESYSYRLKRWRASVAAFLNEGRMTAGGTRVVLATILVVYVGLTGYSAVGALRKPAKAATVHFDKPITQLVGEEILPKQVGQWEQTGVRVINRDPEDPLGANSIIWAYSGEGLNVEFSVDGFYPEWHDLSYCYTALGWKLESAINKKIDQGAPVSCLGLYRDSGDYAVSLFSCFDSRQEAIEPEDPNGTGIRKLVDRLRAGHLMSEKAKPISPPVFQVQLMASQQTAFMPHELRSAERLFASLRESVLVAVKESGNE